MNVNDQAKIRSMKIRTIVDLRFPAEQHAWPSPFLDDATMACHTHAVMSNFGVYNARLHEGVPKLYIDVIQHDPTIFAEVFRVLIHADDATWFYCRVGNVRSGIVAAILLDCVGVPHNEIVTDYMRTALYAEPIMHIMRNEILENTSLGNASQELFDVALWPRPENIQVLLYFLQQRYGGSIGYLEAAGITSDELKKLEMKFTTASDAK